MKSVEIFSLGAKTAIPTASRDFSAIRPFGVVVAQRCGFNQAFSKMKNRDFWEFTNLTRKMDWANVDKDPT